MEDAQLIAAALAFPMVKARCVPPLEFFARFSPAALSSFFEVGVVGFSAAEQLVRSSQPVISCSSALEGLPVNVSLFRPSCNVSFRCARLRTQVLRTPTRLFTTPPDPNCVLIIGVRVFDAQAPAVRMIMTYLSPTFPVVRLSHMQPSLTDVSTLFWDAMAQS